MSVSGMSNSTSHVWVVAALAFVLALAGCGGGEDGGSKSEEGVSKQEFVAKADAICAEANERRDETRTEAFAEDETGPSEEGAAAYAKSMRTVLVRALQRLKALEPPGGDEKTISAMLAQFERALPLVDEVAAAARAGDRAGWERAMIVWSERAVEAQNAAHEYGLKECSRFGTP